MSDNVTIARPYAKAIFNLALNNQQLAAWSIALQALAQTILEPIASRFICNPENAVELQNQLLMSVLAKSKHAADLKHIENLVNLLIKNKRLMLLPVICAQYEMLRAEQEKTLTVQVNSFAKMTEEQEKHLVQSLSERLQRQVILEINIDQSLLGGAVIHAGDLVIDGSVRGKLTKLGAMLAA